ncbi:DUF4125 family protein [Hominifimenecus sp. rT4P-3]|uniref:DUF4125 family protein n=1 Tax=Hominifimenecus sp. rT4P-3 TaxID=3242979 RepID=UPI003DA24D83
MTLEEKKERVVQKEWDFFQEVKNEGGRASCQNDPETFFIMRRSQFAPWPEDLLDSYEADLTEAQADGRNPLTEKYAWMMESTCPERFAKLRPLLPDLSERARQLIESAVSLQLAWMAEYRENYPLLASGNRRLYASEDTPYETSFETYLRGELKTYSERTLKLYVRFLQSFQERGENLTYHTMFHTVLAYGYTSLEDAERQLAGK